MAEIKEQGLKAKIAFVYPDKSAISFVNASRLTHLATDVILDLGVLDEQAFLRLMNPIDAPQPKKKQEQQAPTVEATITHRFGMSFHALLKLRENVEDMVQQLAAKGLLEVVPSEGKKP